MTVQTSESDRESIDMKSPAAPSIEKLGAELGDSLYTEITQGPKYRLYTEKTVDHW